MSVGSPFHRHLLDLEAAPAGDTKHIRHAVGHHLFNDAYSGSQLFERSRATGAQLDEAKVDQVSFHPIKGYDSPAGPQGGTSSTAAVAESMSGEQLWKDRRYKSKTNEGQLGCAASESVVLQHAGYPYANSAGVAQLYGQLKSHGWRPVDPSACQPNDVMFAYVGGKNWGAGGNAHVGTVGSDGEIWNNSARQGETWAKEPADVAFGRYNRFMVLRPPAGR